MTAIILIISILASVQGREPKSKHPAEQESVRSVFECSQSAAEQAPLLREAIANQYWVRRVEFSGNQYTRDKVLRRKIRLGEGDVFTRENLMKSLESLSKLKKIIYPVTLNNVIVRLDRPEKMIDMTICFKERPRHRVRSQQPMPSQTRFRCEGKTRCSQMSSCEEATFYIRNCPGTEMDGDGDGVPCESQWCGR